MAVQSNPEKHKPLRKVQHEVPFHSLHLKCFVPKASTLDFETPSIVSSEQQLIGCSSAQKDEPVLDLLHLLAEKKKNL